jgi:Holliday junction resolvase
VGLNQLGERARVLIETLRLSQVDKSLDLETIAFGSKTTASLVRKILADIRVVTDDGQISLTPKLRVQIALEVARVGRLKEASRFLSWQEFEKFAEECLREAGFRTLGNLRVKGDGRAWQIDLVGYRGELVIAIDCKHWNSPSYASKLKLAAIHQRQRTLHLLETTVKKLIDGVERQQALAVILTLLEPRSKSSEGAVLVSVDKFASFLADATPYDVTLPLIRSGSSDVENPMSQSG